MLNFCVRFLLCLQSSTLGDCLIQREVFCLEQFLDRVAIEEAFNYLISEGFLQAVIITEIARLSEFTE